MSPATAMTMAFELDHIETLYSGEGGQQERGPSLRPSGETILDLGPTGFTDHLDDDTKPDDRIDRRQRYEMSGSPGALRRRGPLRTGRAGFPRTSAQASPVVARAVGDIGFLRCRARRLR